MLGQCIPTCPTHIQNSSAHHLQLASHAPVCAAGEAGVFVAQAALVDAAFSGDWSRVGGPMVISAGKGTHFLMWQACAWAEKWQAQLLYSLHVNSTSSHLNWRLYYPTEVPVLLPPHLSYRFTHVCPGLALTLFSTPVMLSLL